MKIEYNDSKIIIYLFRYKLSFDANEKLEKEVRSVFVKLIKTYHMDFFGYSKVDIYENSKYGSVLEIEKIYNSEYNHEIIDLKLVLHRDCPFYLEFDNYIPLIGKKFLFKNNKYYIDINDIDNIMSYLEFGKIIYCE